MTLSMLWRPHVVYVESSVRKVLDFELPQRPWQPMPGAIGGMRIAGSGVAAAYEVRHDEKREMRLRFHEHEWPAVRRWLRWAQQNPGTTFEWYDDQDDEATLSTVYLHAPAMGTDLVPTPDARFPSVSEIGVVFRISSGAHVNRLYFEDQAAFSYTPGDSLTELGGTFARTGVVYYRDRFGTLRQAATDVLRDAHYDENGVRGTLLEGQRTDSVLHGADLANAAWTKTFVTIEAGDAVLGPDGTTAVPLVQETDDTSQHLVSQSLTITDGEPVAVSLFLKAGGRVSAGVNVSGGASVFSADVRLDAGTVGPDGGGSGEFGGANLLRFEIHPYRDGWYWVQVVGTLASGVTTATVAILLQDESDASAYDGDAIRGIYVHEVGVELGWHAASSPIVTTTAAAARLGEALSFPLPAALQNPQAMTAYVRFEERGTIFTGGSRVWQVGTSGQAGLLLFRNANGVYGFRHVNSVTQTEIEVTEAPTIGDTVEILTVINANGRPDLYQSINGGAVEAIEDDGTAIGLAPEWSSTTLTVGGAPGPSDSGFLALQALRFKPGVRSMDDMREMR